MMKKKILAAALAAIFTVASLTGCGASADENTTATGAGSEAEAKLLQQQILTASEMLS